MATKRDIINELAKKTNQKKEIVSNIMDSFLDFISETLSNGETINITGYLSMKLNFRPSHNARNPYTGETVEVPGKNRISIKAGKILLEAVNPVK